MLILRSIAHSNTSGSLIQTNSYDAFGVPAASNDGLFQYTGQLWLEDAGVYSYKNRTYHAELGVFMQTDPIGQSGGINLYAYVGGDAINLVDPLGLKMERPETSGQPGPEDGCPFSMYCSHTEYRFWLASPDALRFAFSFFEKRSSGSGRKAAASDLARDCEIRGIAGGLDLDLPSLINHPTVRGRRSNTSSFWPPNLFGATLSISPGETEFAVDIRISGASTVAISPARAGRGIFGLFRRWFGRAKTVSFGGITVAPIDYSGEIVIIGNTARFFVTPGQQQMFDFTAPNPTTVGNIEVSVYGDLCGTLD